MGIIKMGKKKDKVTESETKKSVAMQQTVGAKATATPENARTWDDPAVLAEMEPNEHGRHYRLNNGTAKSVICATPVNYYDEDEKAWKEIDNTLEEKEDAFETKCGKCKTEISKAHKGKRVKISKRDKQVCWEYLGKQEAAAAFVVTQTSLKVENGNKKAHRAHSKATYADIDGHTDLEYCLHGNNVKENIIVREKTGDYRYRFALETQGLQMRLAENSQSIELFSENGVEFTIPSPYMYDAAGATSDDVFYELTPASDGKSTFDVVASEEWINADERVLPVTIDPQIMGNSSGLVSAQVQHRNVYTNKHYVSCGPHGAWGSSWICDKTYTQWCPVEPTEDIWVINKSNEQYQTILKVQKSALRLLDLSVISVKMLLTPVEAKSGSLHANGKECYYNGHADELAIDITDDFLQAEEEIEICLCPNSIDAVFSLTDNPPVFEVEYLSEESKPCTRTLEVIDNVQGEFNVSMGDFSCKIATASGEGLSVPYDIAHVFKRSNEEHHCGRGFRMNLHERLVKNTDSTLSANYVYTDALGNKHGFKEHFYRTDNNNQKITVEKSRVTVQADGTLRDNYGNEVFKEQISDTGLIAVTRIEDVACAEMLEQRQDEVKQAQERYDSYKSALQEYVLIQMDNGKITSTLRACFAGKDDTLSPEAYMAFTDTFSDGYMPLPESEAFNYRSMLLQLNALEAQKDSYALQEQMYATQDEAYALQNTANGLQKSMLTYQKVSNKHQCKMYGHQSEAAHLSEAALEMEYNQTVKNTMLEATYKNNLLNNLSQQKQNMNSQYYTFSELKKELALCEDVIADQVDTTSKQITNLSAQREHAKQQNEINVRAGLSNLEQIELLQAQIAAVQSKRAQKIEQLQKYYKEYLQSKAEVEQNRKYAPVNFLQDEKTIKGYNEEGDLVAIFDRYENAIMIERDEKDRIVRVYDDKGKQITFSYNPHGYLSAITDVRGRRTEFACAWGELTQIKYPNGRTLDVTVEGNMYLTQLHETNTAKATMEYSGERLTGINTYGLASKIAHGTTEAGEQLLSTTRILYDTYGVQIQKRKDALQTETYVFDDNNNLCEYYAEENGVVVQAEQYDYEKYVKDNVRYAKKNTLNKAPLSEFVFEAGAYENTELDTFNNPVRVETGGKQIDVNTEQSTQTEYTYDNNRRVTQARRKITTRKADGTEEKCAVIKYSYNAQGSVVRTESYIEGEELTAGKSIEERVYDDKGHTVKSFAYNSLDSSSKFYTESEYDENGKAIAETDETGENRTQIEYVDGTSVVRSKVLPNGSKFSYGRDVDDTVTAITQSTEEGEENSTQTLYTCGVVTKLTSGNNTVQYAYDGKKRKTAVELNGTEYVRYIYEDNAEEDGAVVNKVTATLCNGDRIESKSDTRGNVVETAYNGTLQTCATYDADGKRTSLTDGVTGIVTATEYDALDRVNKVTAGEAVQTTEYNADGNVASKTLSENGKETKYVYAYKDNAAKELKSVTVGDVTVSPTTDILGRATGKAIEVNGKKIAEEHIAYRKVGDHATNMPSTIRFGNVLAKSTASSAHASGTASSVIPSGTASSVIPSGTASSVIPSGTASSVIPSGTASSVIPSVAEESSPVIASEAKQSQFVHLDNLKYTYDSCGNISAIHENGALAAKYAYDKLNRLTREDNKQLGKTWLYSYDNNGNILNKREFAFTLKDTALLEDMPSTDTLYAYNGDRLLAYGNEAFAYDALGNPTVYRGKACAWEKGRQLVSYNGVTFGYDGQGRRTAKGDVTFTYDPEGKLIRQSNGLEFIYDQNGVFGIIRQNSTFFYRRNVQGDIVALIDSSGAVVVKYIYDAWGNHDVEVLDSACAELSKLNPYRYRGYYFDTETGLYYLNTRYYDPEVGRFITIDDLSYLDPETINGLNLYAYCANNPVMNVDPNGKFFLSFLIASIVLGVVIGGAVSGYSAYKVGARGKNLIGAIIGGAIMGGALGSIMVIGGAAGLASLGIATTIVGGSVAAAFGISIGIGIGAGLLSYTAENLIRQNRDWQTSDFMLSGVLGGFQAAITFGMAYAGGRAGVFTGKLTSMSAIDFLHFIVKSTGTISKAQSVVYAAQILFANNIAQFLLVSMPAAIIRSIIKKVIKG